MRSGRTFAALLLGLAGMAHAESDLHLPPVTRATLDNGLKVLIAEYHELPLVEFYLMVGAGAAQDPEDRAGLAALTAATLTHGAGEYNAQELARAIEGLGGKLAAAAGTDGTIASAEFLAPDFSAGLELLRQVLLEPRFTRDEVRRAREEQAAALVAQLENLNGIADQCFSAFLYRHHPYGRPVEGRRTTVPDLGRSDVRDFYDRWYRPNNTLLVLVGDVQAEQALAQLRGAFGGWKARPDAVPTRAAAPTSVAGRRVLLVDKPDATQTQLRMGNLGLKRGDPEYIPAVVANTPLGGGFTSRLVDELRVKRSLTYGAWSQFVARLGGGDFRIGTFTKSPTTVETLKLALSVASEYRRRPPAGKELDTAKTFLRGQFALLVESPDALAAKLAEGEFFGLTADELTTYRTRVANVTAPQAADVIARRIPDAENMVIVVVGKGSEIRQPLEEAFGALQVTTPEGCEELTRGPR